MERWAKSVNTQKQVQQQLIQQMVEQREKVAVAIALEEATQTAVASETVLDIPFGDKVCTYILLLDSVNSVYW